MRTRLGRKAFAILAVGAVLAGGGVYGYGSHGSSGGGGAAGTANVWIDTNGGTCTYSATPVAYSDAAACGDSNDANGALNAAYKKVSGGDTINVKCGTYSVAQTIASRSLGTSMTTIQKDPADNSCTYYTVGDMVIHTSYISVGGFEHIGTANVPHGFNAGEDSAQSCAFAYTNGSWPCAMSYQHITVRDFHTNDGSAIGISYFSMIDGELGPLNAQSAGGCTGPVDSIDIDGLTTAGNADGPNSVAPDHVLIQGMYVHDIQNPSGCGGHTDAIQGDSGYNNWTIRDNFFYNDATCVLVYSPFEANPGVVDTILFENNVAMGNGSLIHCFTFGNKGAAGAAACGSSSLNNVIQNNTFISGEVFDGNCGGSPDGVFRNNIVIGAFACLSTGTDFTFTNNNFEAGDSTCNGTTGASTCTVTFAVSDHTTGNADLASGDTCAKNKLTANYPSLDIHDVSRPQGANADLGAMEYPGG